jgi:hypothetical protein
MNEVRTAMERSADAHPVEFVDEPPPPRILRDMIATPTGSTVVPIPGRKTP